MVAGLFPGNELDEVMAGVDARLGSLPGMEGFSVARDYAAKIRERTLPAPAPIALLETQVS